MWGACACILVAAIPVPPDGGDQLQRETANFAWRTQVVASEASVDRVLPAVQDAAGRSQQEAASAQASSHLATGDVSSLVAAAKGSAEAAAADITKVQELTDQAVKSSHDAALKAAEAAVAKIFQEGEAYYQSRVAALAKLATPDVNPKAVAAQEAALPYMKAALDTGVMVFEYNKKAQDMVAAAWGKAGFGRKLASQAVQEQALGNWEMANRHMIQAHGAMATAQMDEDQAKKIWKLAREFNQVIPGYQGSANQAAAAALALTQTPNGTHVHLPNATEQNASSTPQDATVVARAPGRQLEAERAPRLRHGRH